MGRLKATQVVLSSILSHLILCFRVKYNFLDDKEQNSCPMVFKWLLKLKPCSEAQKHSNTVSKILVIPKPQRPMPRVLVCLYHCPSSSAFIAPSQEN